MDFKTECTEKRKDLNITFKERRSKVLFDNSSRKECLCIMVDGCQITNGTRCDKLLICENNEYFIELKGSDVGHAIIQLESSIKLLSDKNANSRQAYIISTNVSPKISTNIQKSKLYFKRKLNSELHVKRTGYTIKI